MISNEQAERAARLLRDGEFARQRGAELHEAPGSLDEIRAYIAARRAEGANVTGCSWCAKRAHLAPFVCPVCDVEVRP